MKNHEALELALFAFNKGVFQADKALFVKFQEAEDLIVEMIKQNKAAENTTDTTGAKD